MTGPEIYEAHRELIDRVVRDVCASHRLQPADAADFGAQFHLRLVRRDFDLFGKHEGRSSLTTFLRVVVRRAFQDWRNANLGKWRSSVEARRLGPMAVHLERLVVRDGHTMDEAEEMLRTNFEITETRRELEAIFTRLPVRAPRRFVEDAVLHTHADRGNRPDEAALQQEADRRADVIIKVLRRALARLTGEDRLFLRLYFDAGLSMAKISQILHIESKPLYRRRDRLLDCLRQALESNGIKSEDVLTVLNGTMVSSAFEVDEDAEKHPTRVRLVVEDGSHTAPADEGSE